LKILLFNSYFYILISFLFFQGGLILEVVIAKYWANLGDMVIDYAIEFHGIHMINGNLTMLSGDGINRLELRSSLRNEEVVPNISLKTSVQVLKYVYLRFISYNYFYTK